MGFLETILNFFASLFGNKTNTVETVPETEEMKDDRLDATHIIQFIDTLIVNCQHLTEEETIDLKEQAQTCCDLGYTHFVIHTRGRETNPYDAMSGNRYWNCEWLPRAKVMDITNDSNGYSKEQAVAKGLEQFFIENLLS